MHIVFRFNRYSENCAFWSGKRTDGWASEERQAETFEKSQLHDGKYLFLSKKKMIV